MLLMYLNHAECFQAICVSLHFSYHRPSVRPLCLILVLATALKIKHTLFEKTVCIQNNPGAGAKFKL